MTNLWLVKKCRRPLESLGNYLRPATCAPRHINRYAGPFSWIDYCVILLLFRFDLSLLHKIHLTLKVVVERGFAN